MYCYNNNHQGARQFLLFLLICGSAFLQLSCQKNWLNAKSNQQLVIPSTIQDCQAILDNTNSVFTINQPSLGETSADNFYVLYTSWQTITNQIDKNGYFWPQDIYDGNSCGDWNNPYLQVFYANNALQIINTITPSSNEQADWNNVRGGGLYDRAYAYYNLASLFAKPYNAATAKTDFGIPLYLTPDINEKPGRSTLQETYNQITGDLTESAHLLPNTGLFLTRPSKCAAFGMLARVYLSMGSYDSALKYADSSLNINNSLLDFNSLNPASTIPIGKFNTEVIFHSNLRTTTILRANNAIVDSTLYNSYQDDDLRKTIYFAQSGGYTRYKFAYSGSTVFSFGGIVTDEMYLIRAECYARAGKTDLALNDLNTLMVTRWKAGVFTPFTAADADEALVTILTERRKELLFRGIRWTDLRRLNQDSRFAVTLTRVLNGQSYELAANDNRYVLAIPPDEIQISNFPQNPR